MAQKPHDYEEAQRETALKFQQLLDSTGPLTHLSLPERTALVDEISRVVPAGNVPGMVTAGLASLPERVVSVTESRRNLSLLVQGMQTFMDETAFKTFFVGPAVILTAYQMMLKLAGKDVEASFPEGTWQFYVEFGLREDSGRHASETSGFHTALAQDGLKLGKEDELAVWVNVAFWLLNNYHAMLANEWIERVWLRQIADTLPDPQIIARWMKIRPYGVPEGASIEFIDYRRNAFNVFCRETLEKINPRVVKKMEESWNNTTVERDYRLASYQRQMTILSTLNPTEHSDERIRLDRGEMSVGVVSNGRYYLINLNTPVDQLQDICAAILHDKPNVPTSVLDRTLCNVHRRDQPALRRMLPADSITDLNALRKAPIILNWDSASSDQSLGDIRSGRRGVGDHPMTIFRTNKTMVFDQSHIFFDGGWGIAVAEILTNQAIRLARLLPPKKNSSVKAPQALKLAAPNEVVSAARKSTLLPEVNAETTLVKLDLIQQIRRKLQARNDDLRLTVNDVMVLYRSIFGQVYQPSSDMMKTLTALQNDPKTRSAAEQALNSLRASRSANPSILIPMDASTVNPRERIYPTAVRNPFVNMLDQHHKTLAKLDAVEAAGKLGRPLAVMGFEEARKEYLGTVHAFGQIMARYKDVSMKGESLSTSTIKLLAGLPGSVQRLLDNLPNRLDVINDVIKGQEVFSNVGQVAESSSLTRFNTARDDNEKKWLAWGIMTDAGGLMHISLRDFRPHVAALVAVKQGDLAAQMAQEYVDAFALGLNTYIEELLRIAKWRRGENA